MAATIFYILALTALAATAMCITRSNPVHAVIYLVNAFFALALIFYLLGAPLVAAWEVIIYAGAIMVLFLFIIMMLELTPAEMPRGGPGWRRWGPVVFLSAVLVGCTVALMAADPGGADGVPHYYATPRDFGYALFQEYALAVQVVSFQLLYAAVGAYYVGRAAAEATEAGEGEP